MKFRNDYMNLLRVEKKRIKHVLKSFIRIGDILICPFVFLSAWLLFFVRWVGIQLFPVCKYTLVKVGVFPIRDHFYEPLFNPNQLRKPLNDDRHLPGVELNDEMQLRMLEQFQYNDELRGFPRKRPDRLEFYYENENFLSGDSETLYNVVRFFKPHRIIEIGSGNSTLMVVNALAQNKSEDDSYTCEHTCIEPFHRLWIKKLDITVYQKLVEDVDIEIFSTLKRNDILFIDSSHMIRPQGDVLFEYLQILPTLDMGVITHIHDIFTPRDYPEKWIKGKIKFWNEQYLLEAFLSLNKDFEVLLALNYLKHHYPNELRATCPILDDEFYSREPGSFWIRRVLKEPGFKNGETDNKSLVARQNI